LFFDSRAALPRDNSSGHAVQFCRPSKPELMQIKNFRNTLCAGLLILPSVISAMGQRVTRATTLPLPTMLRILRAEDERRWDDSVSSLLRDHDSRVRGRAALAAGRIGNEGAIPALVELLKTDGNTDVRQMAAFAIGEIESFAGADALFAILADPSSPAPVVARSVEALGKIAAALPEIQKEHRAEIGKSILGLLRFENEPGTRADRLTVLLGLTAALRARPESAASVVSDFLNSSDPRILADTLNTMARLRLKDANEKVRQLLSNSDPIVRANAARVVGAKEDKDAFDALLRLASSDPDERVRISAVRALGSLKIARVIDPLVKRGNSLLTPAIFESEKSELLEIASVLGRLLPNTSNQSAIDFIQQLHRMTNGEAVEVETAFARMAPAVFQNDPYRAEEERPNPNWRQISRRAQGLEAMRDAVSGAAAESAGQTALKDAQMELAVMLRRPSTPALAVPDILQAYGSFKSSDAGAVALSRFNDADAVVRASAAELLGEQPPSETNMRALIEALPRALKDRQSNEPALAILGALAKQKSATANDAIKTALDSSDHLVRRRAVALLKTNEVGDFSDRIGTVKTRNTDMDYRRALARAGRKVTATLVTGKGNITIEFLPEDAPLTVDNFVQLARRGYFNGISFHRVVPNFVIQGGDPRGDGNGGPGYQIRCEVNEVPYDRATLGMALSGKDTGGSQWFITHSPQPHLDGGYTVFGRVVRGMDVVDRIARGDIIKRVLISER
jgi:cyclophilin family peptidyl-prolyl cis-trans isomerase/HEAT repeat protein